MKIFLMLIGLLSLVMILFVAACNVWIMYTAQGCLYSDPTHIPQKNVALVLGTSKWAANGMVNLYYRYRIEAAAQLFHLGKVQHLLVSGDNHLRAYNEPIEMMKSLLAAGVPRSAITLDYAGFRTLDSVVRAKEVFSQTDLIVVSQGFHNQRAIFIARRYGITLIGFNAQDVENPIHIKVMLREILARCKAVLDLFILHTQPRFLGEKVNIMIE